MDAVLFVTPARATVLSIEDDAYPSVRPSDVRDSAPLAFWETRPAVTRLPDSKLRSNRGRCTSPDLELDRHGMLVWAEVGLG